ncbi:N-acetylneuraminate synthase family protein [Dyadobacter fanqingshengii]|uniref:N-acetylneuraminate synthase family protein n=1 Tax=Dyadobacter fanqingshengii TaxID=2906443 RepID=A0A9X1PEE3_9BACT|nr:N-acetylneuraminate synthase family protein [Dyadobacter fanqingshengii]MCF0042158.1 N-acetylneuraminate synthase family protein [Dyadobacter fanqingshengii]USJ35310.1 N-acetylneuraminate synthase family protein [Dyadobacter fanqingshengii]
MNGEIYMIAEIGQAHEGSLGLAHSYIDALASSGVNAVKFQVHIAEAESSIHEPFRTTFSYEDPSRMDYWKRMEFSEEEWAGLKAHCEMKKLDFVASPFSISAVSLLERIGARAIKIGSGEMNNALLLSTAANMADTIILSSGMSSLAELDNVIAQMKNKCSLSLLQCTSSYPTGPHQWGLNVIPALKERYQIPIGFSDHSGDIFASLAAVASGAEILEFHVTFDQRMFGPDSTSSINIDQVKQLVKGVRQIETALKCPVDKSDCSEYATLKTIFGKSLAINNDLKKGHIITLANLEAKKPAGYGILAAHFETVVGRQLKHDLLKWSFLNSSDLL